MKYLSQVVVESSPLFVLHIRIYTIQGAYTTTEPPKNNSHHLTYVRRRDHHHWEPHTRAPLQDCDQRLKT